MFNKTKKVKVAIFGRNLETEVGKHELSTKESKIKIRTGGKRNFNPSFNETSYLVLPTGLFGKERVYFVRNGAKACVDFKTEQPEMEGPDQQQVIDAAEAEIIQNFGKESKNTPWYVYVMLGMLAIILVILVQ